jgi:hypothetical protein
MRLSLSRIFFKDTSYERNYISKEFSPSKNQDLIIQIAYHEAGHATAIYLNNKQKQLPPIFFKISIKEMNDLFDFPINPCHSLHENCVAKVEGGRLVHTLPISFHSHSNQLTHEEKQAYQLAYETDIVNLFIGPIAEAKYISIRDDELFNINLINLNALKFYGGTSDIETAHEYLDCFIDNQEQRDEKIAELFQYAHQFVNNAKNWQAISSLTAYILQSETKTIDYEEVTKVMSLCNI